ncbi:hypothetical protein NIES21_56280 [Anabaenopsis circularis NIES-21]|uniref:Uncharacterized protein n=1 Tax=Anabaenopsis circularis NIES-21 TaxID=1085406 RepID=A0A1Z4GQK8_9CYAN|nr:hypothetical protein NIES21_56280 [Anabaenopsis circularis NIES-21]
MTSNPNPTADPNILGKFTSVIGLLGAALFFAGWIYRWAYFSFFQLEISNLDLPAQSFLIVPIQIFLGDGWTICRTAIAFVLAAIAINLTLWLIRITSEFIVNCFHDLSHRIIRATQHRRSITARFLNSLVNYSSQQLRLVDFLRSLVNEIVIVSWVLIVIFWLAQWQGIADARRDAGQNSTLPVIAFITPGEKFVAGRKLEDEFTDPLLKGYKIIGDRGLFEDLRGKEDTDVSNPQQPRVWRLLLERSGWIYLFSTLPPNAPPNNRPAVIAIQEGDPGHLLILAPEVSKTIAP